MTDPLLQTKLYMPQARPATVPRPRLIDKLTAGLESGAGTFGRKVTLISAPAGFGKTTLAVEWLSTLTEENSITHAAAHPYSRSQIAWLSLDEQDNEPLRFFSYLVAALQQVDSSIGQAVQQVLASPQPSAADGLMTLLVNDLAFFDRPIILVLDDYHQIHQKPLHEALAFFIDNQPPNLHLVLITRRNPPFPLARWRVQGELFEVRRADLRFTRSEIDIFFQQTTAVDLGEANLVTLEARTEGWVASLQLAAIAMQGQGGPSNPGQIDHFVESFGGTHHFVFDYLVSEVLAKRPPGTQDFLLQTSILNRFSASLCQAVTGRDDSQALLETLEEANLFLIPLDDQRQWYRYHHLFADLLRQRLNQQQADQVAGLHKQASIWYEENGFFEEAIEISLSGADYERAADLITGVAQAATWRYGEYVRLAWWIDQLPEALVTGRPQLCIYYAWGLFVDPNRTDRSAPERWLRTVEKTISGTSDPSPEQLGILGQVAAIRASRARIQGDTKNALTEASAALAQLPERPSFWRSLTRFNLAATCFLGDDDVATEEALVEAKVEALAAGDKVIEIAAVNMQAQLRVRQGDLGQAAGLYRQALGMERRVGPDEPQLFTAGMAYLGLADLAREGNRLSKAAGYLERGLSIGRRTQHPITLLAGAIVLARLAQTRGELPTARDHIQRAADLASSTHQAWIWLAGPLASTLARLWLRQNEPDLARETLEEAPSILSDPPELSGFWNENMAIAWARVFLTLGQPARARPFLAPMAMHAEEMGRMGSLVELLILQALAAQLQKQTDKALKTLGRALSLAEPAGYVRLFLDEGQPLARLLAQLPATSYRDMLLGQFPATTETEIRPAITRQPLGQSLTKRELEVLGLMTSHLSGATIARQLHISVNTYKSHIKNIYGKLGVHSREEAVIRARELNLL